MAIPLAFMQYTHCKEETPGSSRQIPQVSPGQEAEQGEAPRGTGGKETGEKSKNSLEEPPACRPLPRPTFTYSDPDKVRPGTWGLGTDTLCMRNGAA